MISVVHNNDIELKTLTESLNEDYLTRARTFAYLIEKDAAVLKNGEELKKILTLLNVDELHVSDDKGIIQYSTVKKYVGLDFHHGKQMREFLKVLDSDSKDAYLVQEVQPNTAEQKMMQYVGVQRPDQKGIVQVGLEPARLIEAKKRNTYPYIFNHIPIDIDESIFAIDIKTSQIIAHTNEQYEEGDLIKDMGLSIDDFLNAKDGKIMTIDGLKRYIYVKEYNGVLFGAGIPTSTLFENRMRETVILAFYLMLIYIISLLVLNKVINFYIINGVHKIIDDLEDIQKGHLEKKINVNKPPELKRLGQGINSMVQAILNATVRTSQIIDMTGMLIASFECRHDVRGVLGASRLKEMMHLSDDKAKELFENQTLFLEYLDHIFEHAVGNHIYQIAKDQYVKIHIAHEDEDVYGTIEDVTDDYLHQRHLKYESEHDGLTHLLTYKTFLRKVETLIDESDDLESIGAMMLDLDNFKQINDQYGHDFGDDYLLGFSKCLQDYLPKEKVILARRSGDEFCLFFHHFQSQDEILEMVHGLWQTISKQKISYKDMIDVHMSVSGGLTWCFKSDVNELMECADQQLYHAKNEHKGYFSVE